MIQLVLTMTLTSQIIWTVLIALGIIGTLILEKIFVEKAKENISNWIIVSSYIVIFVLLLIGIFGIMIVWGYDSQAFFTLLWDNILNTVITNVNKLITSGFVIAINIALLKVLKLSLKRIGKKPSPMQRRKRTIAKITMSIAKYGFWIIAFTIILSVWGVNVGPVLAGVGAIGLIIGLGAQRFINDLISGFFIIFEHHFDVGDTIEVKGFKGVVSDIGLKTTKIRNWKGEVKIMNNGDINDITNFSFNESVAVVEFGIAYKEDIARTTTILNQELIKLRLEMEEIIENPIVMGVTDLSSSSVNLRVIAKTKNEQHYAVERKLRQRIKEILDENKIEIPFPQVVVHGVKHGN
jgi:small-conductance mechanosensitive channel